MPGILSMTEFANPEHIKKGSPLGELMQWADLIASLHLLGHHVILEHRLNKGFQL